MKIHNLFRILSLKDDRMICIELNLMHFFFEKGKRKIWHLGGWQISEGQSSLKSVWTLTFPQTPQSKNLLSSNPSSGKISKENFKYIGAQRY